MNFYLCTRRLMSQNLQTAIQKFDKPRTGFHTRSRREQPQFCEMKLRRVGDDAVPAVALGAVERLVGALEDRGGVVIDGIERRQAN